MSGAFYEGESNLLTPQAFAFVLEAELKRAVRSQNYVTLVVVEATYEQKGMTMVVDESTLHDLARVFGKEIRETDFLGRTESGTLAVSLWDADIDHSAKVIDRVVSRIENYDFRITIQIAVRAACCPTHAVDVDSLKRQAARRPVVSWRAVSRSFRQEN